MNHIKASTDGNDLAILAEKMGLSDICICFIDEIEPGYQNYIIHLRSPAHWVGLVIYHNIAYYFDSLNLPIIPKKIISMVDRIIYNDIEIQPINEAYCGEYVLDYISHMRKPSIKAFNKFLMNFK